MAPLVILATWAAMASGIMAATSKSSGFDNGPSAFIWPPDRVWSAEADNIPPCGSIAGVQNRTQFPLENGEISLISKLESYDLELSISYEEDPKTNSQFERLVDMETFRTMEVGHTCVELPKSPSSVRPNTNATLQIKYTARESTNDEMFYACTDITFVEPEVFKSLNIDVMCFNATRPKSGSDSSGSTSSDSSEKPLKSMPAPEFESGGSGGGAIAGVVIGSLAALALLVAGGVVISRRRRQRLRLLRQQNSERGKWASETHSQTSVAMNKI